MNIVLVHGILGFCHLDLPLVEVDYFAGVADHLQERFQASVLAPALDPTEGTEVRSSQLRNAIGEALRSGQLDPARPIYIIAHSLGGLDARRMIADNPVIDAGGSQVPVKALATISTPHRGSPIADAVALKFLRGLEESDGMVTVSSAKWSGFDSNLWPCDHADEIGHDLDHPLQKVNAETLSRFEKIVQGFQIAAIV